MKKEYKVEIIKEGALGTIILGSSKLPLKKMEEVMNKYGENGWDVSFQLIEKHRMLFLWSREAVIITFSRNKQQINNEKTTTNITMLSNNWVWAG